MSSLILELKQGESMILNGALIRFKTKTRLELNSHARFLFGKQVLSPEDVTTPMRRAYYALQQAYLAPDRERPEVLAQAQEEVRRQAQPTSEWNSLLALCTEDTLLAALKLARQIIQLEDARNETSLESTLETSG